MSNRRKTSKAPQAVQRETTMREREQLALLAAQRQPVAGACWDCDGYATVRERSPGDYQVRTFHRDTCPGWQTLSTGRAAESVSTLFGASSAGAAQ